MGPFRLEKSASFLWDASCRGHAKGLFIVFGARINLFLLMTLLAASAHGYSGELRLYRESNGNENVYYIWEKRQSNGTTSILVRQGHDEFYENIYDKSGATVKWISRTNTGDITALRTGNEISIKGTDKGLPIDKVLKIDNCNWYQAMTYSLERLASGEGNSIESFWIIRADSLEAVKIRATRKGTDSLKINNINMDADMVEVTLDNKILAMLWHGHYWFRKNDHVFIQYKGSNGPPYTDKTLIRLEHDHITAHEAESYINKPASPVKPDD